MKIFTATALFLALSAVALAKPAPDNFRAPQSPILQDWSSPPPGTSFAVVQNTAPTPIPERRFTTGSGALNNGTTPNIGSPEWKKEQTDNERKEQRLKQIIEGICSNCTAKPTPKPEPERFATASPTLDNGTTPNIGSAEWKKEQADNERKEQRLKRIIENICSNCTAKPTPIPEPERFTTGSGALDNGTTPNIGSPEWKKEQADNERKEQSLKRIIENICSNCTAKPTPKPDRFTTGSGALDNGTTPNIGSRRDGKKK